MKWHIGTSGYYYNHWKELFYPKKLKKENWLPFYARHFSTVEINNTFYGVPSVKTLNRWYETTPPSFLFTIKGNRYVTHVKRLLDPAEGMRSVYETIEPLKEKVRCVLWQLPGSLAYNKERLMAFAQACSHQYENVIEFRHTSWFTKDVFEILRKKKIAFCAVSAPGELPDLATKTTKIAYIRFHGHSNWYQDLYSENELRQWVFKISGTGAEEVFAYFNNDHQAHAIQNAQDIQRITAEYDRPE